MITGVTNQSKNAAATVTGARKAGIYSWGDPGATWGDSLATWGGADVVGTNQSKNNIAGATGQSKS
jgi:hypothetical protein